MATLSLEEIEALLEVADDPSEEAVLDAKQEAELKKIQVLAAQRFELFLLKAYEYRVRTASRYDGLVEYKSFIDTLGDYTLLARVSCNQSFHFRLQIDPSLYYAYVNIMMLDAPQAYDPSTEVQFELHFYEKLLKTYIGFLEHAWRSQGIRVILELDGYAVGKVERLSMKLSDNPKMIQLSSLFDSEKLKGMVRCLYHLSMINAYLPIAKEAEAVEEDVEVLQKEVKAYDTKLLATVLMNQRHTIVHAIASELENAQYQELVELLAPHGFGCLREFSELFLELRSDRAFLLRSLRALLVFHENHPTGWEEDIVIMMKSHHREDLINQIIYLSSKANKEGVLTLISLLDGRYPFLDKVVEMAIDGNEPAVIENFIYHTYERLIDILRENRDFYEINSQILADAKEQRDLITVGVEIIQQGYDLTKAQALLADISIDKVSSPLDLNTILQNQDW